MLKVNVGDVVMSTKGRDINSLYIVCGVENDYALLVDGRGKTILNPKKKKFKHFTLTGQNVDSLKKKFLANEKVLDSEIRKTINNLNII